MSKAKILQLMENGQKCYPKTHVEAIDGLSALGEILYPVGAVYLSVNPVDPADIFGGKWEKVPEAMIWSTSDEEAGEYIEKEPFELKSNNMPNHNHYFYGTQTSFLGEAPKDTAYGFLAKTDDEYTGIPYVSSGITSDNKSDYTFTRIMSYPEKFTVHAWYRIA